LRCIALHFVKERIAYSISNFSDFKFNTAIYNKDLKYASFFKFFFGELQRVVVHLHLLCIVQTQLQTCIACSTALQVVISVHIAKP